METDNAGTVQAVYTYGNDMISMKRADVNSFYLYDGLGSTRQLTDDDESVAASYTYDSFGNVIASSGSSTNAYGFTGEQQFSEADSLVFLRARYCSPRIGRFISKDPVLGLMGVRDNFFWPMPSLISRPQSLHPYVYTQNNPANLIDPRGLKCGRSCWVLGNFGLAAGPAFGECWYFCLISICKDDCGNITRSWDPIILVIKGMWFCPPHLIVIPDNTFLI